MFPPPIFAADFAVPVFGMFGLERMKVGGGGADASDGAEDDDILRLIGNEMKSKYDFVPALFPSGAPQAKKLV